MVTAVLRSLALIHRELLSSWFLAYRRLKWLWLERCSQDGPRLGFDAPLGLLQESEYAVLLHKHLFLLIERSLPSACRTKRRTVGALGNTS